MTEILIQIAAMLCMWPIVSLLLALLSGWRRLAKHYRVAGPLEGDDFYMQGIRLGAVFYSGCVKLKRTPVGLNIALLPVFSLWHPPLLIPWTELTYVGQRHGLFGTYVDASVGEPSLAKIRFPAHVLPPGSVIP